MLLGNKTVLFVLVLSLAGHAQMKSPPVLKAKQALDNIRFISKDGKYTYYQRRSGDLQVFTNYDNKVVIEGQKLTQYSLSASETQKKIVILKDDSFHDQLSHLKSHEIYTIDFGGASAKLHGKGQGPKLHQNDRFISYLLPTERKIYIVRTTDGKKTSVPLLSASNDFFLPDREMPTPNDLIYTDVNDKGEEAVLIRSLIESGAQTIYKATRPGNKIEICLAENSLIIGEFPRGASKGGTRILEVPLYMNKDYKKSKTLYQTQQADIGNMACLDEEIYFIKTLSLHPELNLKESEVARLSLKDQKVDVLTDLGKVTQIVVMDGMVLAPLRGKYFIIKGPKNLTDDSIKEEKERP